MNQPLPSEEQTAGQPRFSIALLGELDEISRLSAWMDGVGRRLALDSHRLYAVQLCLEEVVANVILYARPADGTDALEIEVSVANEGPTLQVLVEDNGQAFNPTMAAEPKTPESLNETPIGGLGLKLVRRFSSHLRYSYQDQRNRVTLEFADHLTMPGLSGQAADQPICPAR
jgi:serine/threonine-protein kinase RsbW